MITVKYQPRYTNEWFTVSLERRETLLNTLRQAVYEMGVHAQPTERIPGYRVLVDSNGRVPLPPYPAAIEVWAKYVGDPEDAPLGMLFNLDNFALFTLNGERLMDDAGLVACSEGETLEMRLVGPWLRLLVDREQSPIAPGQTVELGDDAGGTTE